MTQHYLDVLDKVAAAGLDAQISIKPTQLGLDLDRGAVRAQPRSARRARRAASATSVWIDMESSPYVDPTLELFTRARAQTRARRHRHPGLPSARAKDIEALIPLGAAIRIVKGAYLEPPDVAFPKKSDVDENFFTLCTRLMAADAQQAGVAAAHRDPRHPARRSAAARGSTQHNVPASAYEFAMLYGIQRQQQLRLAQEGQRLRVLISYGEYWFPWYMRRLAERPANVWFVLKNDGG